MLDPEFLVFLALLDDLVLVIDEGSHRAAVEGVVGHSAGDAVETDLRVVGTLDDYVSHVAELLVVLRELDE